MLFSGKALELAAYIIQDNFVGKNSILVSEALNDENIEKIFIANHILIDKIQTLPTLSRLALSVGTNTKK